MLARRLWSSGTYCIVRPGTIHLLVVEFLSLLRRLRIVKTFVHRCGDLRLRGGLDCQHFARLAGDLRRVRNLAVLLVRDLLQIFLSPVLIRDLIVHELGELASAIQLLSALLLNHPRLIQNPVFLVALALLLRLLITNFLLLARMRVHHQALDAVRDRVFNALLLFLPLDHTPSKQRGQNRPKHYSSPIMEHYLHCCKTFQMHAYC